MKINFADYKFKKFLDFFINIAISIVCLVALYLILGPLFFYEAEWMVSYYPKLSKVLFASFIALNFFKYINHFIINSAENKKLFKRTILYASFSLLFFLEKIFNSQYNFKFEFFILLLLSFLGLKELFKIILELDKRYTKIVHLNLSGIQIFVFSFFTTAVIGTLLLLTPKASVGGLSFLDALFMSISATCVTGLAVVSTEHDLTVLGQIIVMTLFQIGGLGTMTFAIGLSGIFGNRISFKNKVLISDTSQSNGLANIRKILLNTFFFTFFIEFCGALFFLFKMPYIQGQSFLERIYHAVFHAISAFCNAGFSLSDASLSSSTWSGSTSLLLVTALLIILGGLGFPVLMNLYSYILKQEKLNLHSKVVLFYSSVFLAFGAVIVYLLERQLYFENQGAYYSILNSFFTSVTSRTAGFNSIDFSSLSSPTLFFISGLMFIGGAPMSTAGGLKVTTFAVAFSHIFGRIRKYKKPILFNRSLSDVTVTSSLDMVSLSLFVVFLAIFLMSVFEKDMKFISVFFEAFSALGTVGLSTGITADLSSGSKMILCLLMFLGRVNILLFFDSVIKDSKKTRIQYVEEDIVL